MELSVPASQAYPARKHCARKQSCCSCSLGDRGNEDRLFRSEDSSTYISGPTTYQVQSSSYQKENNTARCVPTRPGGEIHRMPCMDTARCVTCATRSSTMGTARAFRNGTTSALARTVDATRNPASHRSSTPGHDFQMAHIVAKSAAIRL